MRCDPRTNLIGRKSHKWENFHTDVREFMALIRKGKLISASKLGATVINFRFIFGDNKNTYAISSLFFSKNLFVRYQAFVFETESISHRYTGTNKEPLNNMHFCAAALLHKTDSGRSKALRRFTTDGTPLSGGCFKSTAPRLFTPRPADRSDGLQVAQQTSEHVLFHHF